MNTTADSNDCSEAARVALAAWSEQVRARIVAATKKVGRTLSYNERRAVVMQMGLAPMSCCGRTSGHARGCFLRSK